MEVSCIPYGKTAYFSTLIRDYLDEKPALRPFYNRFPDLKAFGDQIEEKAANYPAASRKILNKALEKQYEGTTISDLTRENIAALKKENTFTVVTGHQLNLFTGPLYFLYKIISTINLCKELSDRYPESNFVPVYWMATEDHDFEEICYFNFKGQKVTWDRETSGAVGKINTDGLSEIHQALAPLFGRGSRAEYLADLFEKAYVKHPGLSAATRFLANELFGEDGLVIIDGDDAALKKLLIPYIKKDVLKQTTHTAVNQTIENLQLLEENYKVQVDPREINYFYLREDMRERIIEKEGQFHVQNTGISFSREAMEEEIDTYPQRFSPNVITRPLYQEVILPNLCYIGGGGELA